MIQSTHTRLMLAEEQAGELGLSMHLAPERAPGMSVLELREFSHGLVTIHPDELLRWRESDGADLALAMEEGDHA